MLQASAVKVSNVTFREIIGVTMKKIAVILDCSATMACNDIVLDNINLQLKDGSSASYNIRDN